LVPDFEDQLSQSLERYELSWREQVTVAAYPVPLHTEAKRLLGKFCLRGIRWLSTRGCPDLLRVRSDI